MSRCYAYIIGWLVVLMVVNAEAHSGGMVALSRAQIERSIKKEIDKIIPAFIEQYEVEYRRIPETIDVPEGVVQIQTELGKKNKHKGYIVCSVHIKVNQRPYKRISPSVKVRVFEQVVAAGVDIPRYDGFSETNLKLQLVETTQLQQTYFHKPDSLLKLRAKRFLRAGTVITDHMIS